jgi:Cu/Ag efflux protein CusF
MVNLEKSVLLLAFLLMLSIASCSNRLAKKDSRSDQANGRDLAVQTTSHQGVGVVKGLNPKLPSIELDHEEIKGLMPAMQMQFYVRDSSMLDNLAVGEIVEFTVENGVGGLKIVSIKKR